MSKVRFSLPRSSFPSLNKTATKNTTLSLSSIVIVCRHGKIGKRPWANPLYLNATLTSTPLFSPFSEKRKISNNGRFSFEHQSQPGTKGNWFSSVMPHTPCYLVRSPLPIQSESYSKLHRPGARRLPSNRRLGRTGNSPNECNTQRARGTPAVI